MGDQRRHDQDHILKRAFQNLSFSTRRRAPEQFLSVTVPLHLSSSQSSPVSSPTPKTSQTVSPFTSNTTCRPYSPYDSEFNISSSASSVCSLSTSKASGSDISSPLLSPSHPPLTPSYKLNRTSSTSSACSLDSAKSHHQCKYSWQLCCQDDITGSYCNSYRVNEEESDDEAEYDINNTPASALDTTERDVYGFKLPAQWIKIKYLRQFEEHYHPIRQDQEMTWNSLLAEHDGVFPPTSESLKQCARKGIPNSLRGKAWLHYSGAKAKMDANLGLFESLLKTAISMGEHNEHAEIIHRDLHRTFPDNTQFACSVTDTDGSISMSPESNPKLKSLQRILLAFSVHSPQIGYCQSLNYLVGFFLLFVDEEEAFWLLVTTVLDYFPSNMYDVTMEGTNIDQTVLMMTIYERMPGIWNKISNGKDFWECEQSDGLPPTTLVTSHWFLTLFINILPVETVLRTWDCFFVEGYEVMFRVALTIIKMNERKIWALEDPIEIFHILQNMPRRLIDCHGFMECVFSQAEVSVGPSQQEIDGKRTLFRDRRRQRRAFQKNTTN